MATNAATPVRMGATVATTIFQSWPLSAGGAGAGAVGGGGVWVAVAGCAAAGVADSTAAGVDAAAAGVVAFVAEVVFALTGILQKSEQGDSCVSRGC